MARPRTGVRVIAGTARGRRLETPPGLGTRPITDRVKESLFGTLQPRLPGATVLDLFAGSGAMAVEAMSRGASSAVLVERDGQVVELIRRNLVTTGFADRAEARRGDVATVLRGTPPREPFDLVFVDPPYAMADEEVEAVLALLVRGWVSADSLVVVRRQARSAPPRLPEGWEFARTRTYGDTLVLLASFQQEL